MKFDKIDSAKISEVEAKYTKHWNEIDILNPTKDVIIDIRTK